MSDSRVNQPRSIAVVTPKWQGAPQQANFASMSDAVCGGKKNVASTTLELGWLTTAEPNQALSAQSRERSELVTEKTLRSIADGDQHALATLYDRTSSVVIGMGRRMLQDQAEAEEAVSDVFHYVWRHAGNFDPNRGSATAWFLIIARSRILDRLRSNRSRSEHEEHLEETAELFTANDNPERNAMLGQMARRARAALERLPREQRHLIEMAYFLGLSHSELAERAGLPLGTVKTRIRAGMSELRKLLSEAGQ
jgi:RNA polymerase sigma-70 factor, ECF subfamily